MSWFKRKPKHVHDWSQWSKPSAFGFELYQRRTCITCLIQEQRKIGWETERDRRLAHAKTN